MSSRISASSQNSAPGPQGSTETVAAPSLALRNYEAALTPAHGALLRQLQRSFNATPQPSELWPQVSQKLGSALCLSGCLAYSYCTDNLMLPLAAAYGLGADPLAAKASLPLDTHNTVSLALAQLDPIVVAEPAELIELVEDQTATSGSVRPTTPQVAVLVPVTYRGEPKGLLLLYRPAAESWTGSELLLLADIGDSLGAAIAHGMAIQENLALDQKLHQVKDDFLYKHKEIEEAHREAELAYQEAEEASRLKSEFLANTSHELRTPLNGMIGFLKLVIDGMADTEEELQEFVGEAHNSALLLLDIINDILDVAKIEAGKMELDLSVVQLNELFEDVSKKTRRQALARNLLYEITPPKTHDEVIVYGDYQRLLQVLLNLVGNALKFTHSGSIAISSRIIEKAVMVNDEEMPGLLEIRVADTGIGVSLDQQAKLFKSFSQVDGSRTRQYGGTGLGLVISQKLVEAMGGEVHFYSMGEELGSTVTFTVPLYQKPVMKASTESELDEAEAGLA